MVFESFRRQQKTFLAFLAIAAMFAFILGSVFSNYAAPAPGANVYFGETADGKGTPVEVYGRKISIAEIRQLADDRQKVSEFIRQAQQYAKATKNNFQPFPTGDADLVLGIALSRKAEKLGINPTDDDVKEFLDEVTEGKLSSADFAGILSGKINVSGDPDAKPLKLSDTRLFSTLKREIALNQAFRALVPPPIATYEAPIDYWEGDVSRLTEISLKFIELPVAKYIDPNAQPTEQEIKETYNKYATVETGSVGSKYGFLNPRRVDAQFFEAKAEAFLAAHQVTDEEIAQYYEAHKTDFVETPTPTLDEPAPSTNPPAPPSEPGETPSAPPAAPANPPEEAPSTPEPAPSAPPETPAPAEPAPQSPANPEPPANPPAAPEGTPQASVSGASSVETVVFLQEEAEPAEPKSEENPPAPAKPESEPTESTPPPAETSEPAPPADPAPATPPAPTDAPADPLDTLPPAPATEPPKAPEPPKVKPLEQVKEEIRTILLKQKAGEAIKNAMQEVVDNELTPYYFEVYKPARFSWASSHRAKEGSIDWKGFTPPAGPDFSAIAAKQGWTLKSTGLLTLGQLEKTAGLGKATRVDRRQINKDVPESATRVLFGGEESEDLYAPRILFDADTDTYFAIWKTQEIAPTPIPLEEVKDQVIEAWRMEKAREQAKKVAEEFAKKAKDAGDDLQAALPNADEYKIQETESFPRTRDLPVGANMFQPMQIPVTIANIPNAGEPFLDEVFALKEGEVAAVPNDDASNYYIVKVATRKEPEFSKFASDYRLYVSNMISQAAMGFGEGRTRSLQGILVPDILRDAGIDPAVFQRVAVEDAPKAN